MIVTAQIWSLRTKEKLRRDRHGLKPYLSERRRRHEAVPHREATGDVGREATEVSAHAPAGSAPAPDRVARAWVRTPMDSAER